MMKAPENKTNLLKKEYKIIGILVGIIVLFILSMIVVGKYFHMSEAGLIVGSLFLIAFQVFVLIRSFSYGEACLYTENPKRIFLEMPAYNILFSILITISVLSLIGAYGCKGEGSIGCFVALLISVGIGIAVAIYSLIVATSIYSSAKKRRILENK